MNRAAPKARWTAQDVWWEFLSDKGHCGLCGNSGVIDTRGRIFTAAGVETGVCRYCICPNGRAIRKALHGQKWPRCINDKPSPRPSPGQKEVVR